jgi:hypothetical protein
VNKTSRFVYHQRSPEDVERNMRRVTLRKLREALRHANAGNLNPLHDFLRDYLPDDHVDALAEWHKRRLRRDLIKNAPSSEREAENTIAGLAIHEIKMLQRQFGKLPSGTYPKVIDWAATVLAEDGELYRSDPANIDYNRILKIVRRSAYQRFP